MLRKTYICDLCKKELKDVLPIRFIQQEYGVGRYKQYYPVAKFDLCVSCYNLLKLLFKDAKNKVR